MNVAIIDYGAGNTQSVKYAFENLGVNSFISNDKEEIRSADRVVLPGVGHAKTALDELRSMQLDQLILDLTQPFLGICLGMQLLCEINEEGGTGGLGVFKAKVQKFKPAVKVPHMGWNNLIEPKSPLFKGIDPNSYVYFVHSYFVHTNQDTIGVCDYDGPFSAALNKDNFYGCQFHPEKSGETGMKILQNFIEL